MKNLVSSWDDASSEIIDIYFKKTGIKSSQQFAETDPFDHFKY